MTAIPPQSPSNAPPAGRYEFCTYFDQRYVSRGIALYRSLRRHCPSFRLWVLCLDDATLASLRRLDLPHLVPIPIADFEAAYPALAAARANRSLIEYYFTCTPALPLFVFDRDPDVSLVTYVDADVSLFGDPGPLFDRLGDRSIAVTPHRYAPGYDYSDRFGLYNVGWLSFRNDADARAVLARWLADCIDWCYDAFDGERFADQKYLDRWPEQSNRVWVIDSPGAGLAPWNAKRHVLSRSDANVHVDGVPLVFFHFHGLLRLNPWVYDTNLPAYGIRPGDIVRAAIYKPYLHDLKDAERLVAGFKLERRPLRTIRDGDVLPGRPRFSNSVIVKWTVLPALHVWRGIAQRGYVFTSP